MLDAPDDSAPRLVFADWLEERDDPRGELIRLLHDLYHPGCNGRDLKERRLRELLELGASPPGPFLTLTSLNTQFALIPPGSLRLGSSSTEVGRGESERQRIVCFQQAFFMGTRLVTQEQWQQVMGSNPSRHRGQTDLPVETVSWDMCQQFCRKIAELPGWPFGWTPKLPTENQWEFACRAGSSTPFHFGETISRRQANFGAIPTESGDAGADHYGTTPVASFPPNAFGLFDMHGNVGQWCRDRQFRRRPVRRAVRSGGYSFAAINIRSSNRGGLEPSATSSTIGMRVCLER